MNPINMDGCHAKIEYDEGRDPLCREILGLSEGAEIMARILMGLGRS